ncbi:hypothetical protein [Burkholderia sp. Tr-20390]|uniref:hypothetical protein n=1 Tax=Burkholderia sp. Tr-20390 TaxID=2703904 RepID=UPI00197EA09A|nr:hypothetical protein [Burkholderia sp. Tr-20390]MBN3736105.1 hypothetical protein [Burkholderia sp. Tr-20390]
MSRLVSVSGDGTGVDLATAMNAAQCNAQVVIIGRRANVLEHAAEAIDGVFPDVRPPRPDCRLGHA